MWFRVFSVFGFCAFVSLGLVLLCVYFFPAFSPSCEEALGRCPKLILSNLLSLQRNIR